MTAVHRSVPQRPNVYLIVGDDEYAVTSKAREIVTALCPPEQQTLGLEVIEGRVDTVDEALAALARCLEGLRTVGLLGGRKVVWLREADCFRDSVVGRSEAVKARVDLLTEEIRKGLAEDQFLVVSAPKVDGRSAFFKACQAAGRVFAYEKPEKSQQAERQAVERAEQALEEAGLRMSGEDIEYLVQKTGTDTRQIVQEVEKLSVYMGRERAVRREHIDAVVCSAREAVAWDLTDAACERDALRALAALRRLFAQKESAVGLLFALESRYRDLTVMRWCADRGWVRFSQSGRWTAAHWSEATEVEEALGWMGKKDPRKMHPYRAWLLFRQAVLFTPNQLQWCRKRILAAHEQMVSRSVPEELILEVLVLELAAVPKSRASVPAQRG